MERDDMEFQHHFFIQGQPELLPHIKRKVTQPNPSSQPGSSSTQVALMQQDALIERANMEEKVDNLEMSLKVLQATQDVVNEQLVTIKRENGTLWQELSLQRQKHLKQQQITHKLLQFIMHSVLPSSSSSARPRGSISHGKRKFPPLMIDQPAKRAATSDGLTHSASIDNALEAIEDVFAASPDVVQSNPMQSSGPIIREIPLEAYEASVAMAAAAAASSNSTASSSSNGQSSSSSSRPTQQQRISNISSTVTQPTFATAVAEDGSTVLLMQNPQPQFVTTMQSQQHQQHQQRQSLQQNQERLTQPLQFSSTVPIITPVDSPAERQAPSPASSIQSVPSPAPVSVSVSPKPPNIVIRHPSGESGGTDSGKFSVANNAKRNTVAGGKHGGKNLPLLNTSTSSNSNAVVTAFNKANAGGTPEIIDTPTLTDFISTFPIMAQEGADGGSTTTATTMIRNKNGTSVKTDTLGAAVMLSGVNADEHELEEDEEDLDEEAATAENRQAQSPSPRGLARSLSKKIDTVDAGLEGIKDMLVAQSPDLNMDASDLLNLFMPEGPITTDPRTPIALDDFLSGGASPFNWPSVPISKALPAPMMDKKTDLSTPKFERK